MKNSTFILFQIFIFLIIIGGNVFLVFTLYNKRNDELPIGSSNNNLINSEFINTIADKIQQRRLYEIHSLPEYYDMKNDLFSLMPYELEDHQDDLPITETEFESEEESNLGSDNGIDIDIDIENFYEGDQTDNYPQ